MGIQADMDPSVVLVETAKKRTQQGAYADAENLLKKALALRSDLLGEDHEETADIRTELATLSINLQRFEDARRYLYQALRTYHRLFGSEHPSIAAVLSILGVVCCRLGETEDAERLCISGLEMCRRVHTASSPHTATAALRLALVYFDAGRLSEAIVLYEEGLTVHEAQETPEIDSIAAGYNNLAMVYCAQDRWDDAVILLSKALHLGSLLPENSAVQSATRIYLVYVRYRQGDHAVAESDLREVLPDLVASHGPDFPFVLLGEELLFATLFHSQRFEEAYGVLRRLPEKSGRVRGETHPETASIYFGLGVVCTLLDRLDEAEVWHKKALAIREQTLGKTHTSTVASYHHLTALYGEMEKRFREMGLL
ncbi:MAG: tetratricopeptide repeat-containing protein [Capsulimonadales bacterium]|nr:tetratricopeptide repeat-containing protein [Capsulimonadales bacterium]